MNRKGCGGICEIVGLEEFQVKPYFDIDAKIDLDKSFDETVIDDIENDIKKYHLMKLLLMILKMILKKYVIEKFIEVKETLENMMEKRNIHSDYI